MSDRRAYCQIVFKDPKISGVVTRIWFETEEAYELWSKSALHDPNIKKVLENGRVLMSLPFDPDSKSFPAFPGIPFITADDLLVHGEGGISIAEAARILDIQPKSVRSAISKGRLQICGDGSIVDVTSLRDYMESTGRHVPPRQPWEPVSEEHKRETTELSRHFDRGL